MLGCYQTGEDRTWGNCQITADDEENLKKKPKQSYYGFEVYQFNELPAHRHQRISVALAKRGWIPKL
jgi:hypothetical protein